MKLIITHVFLSSCYLLPLGCKYPPQHLFAKRVQCTCFSNLKDQILNTYKEDILVEV